MPGFDGIGPGGLGSLTGGGRGFCAIPVQGQRPAYWRRRFARQSGFPVYPDYTGQNEITYLKDMTNSLTTTLEEIEKRIEQLETGK